MNPRRFSRALRPGQVSADVRRDIQEEIELYLDLRAQELEENEGLGPEEARRVARERFGDPERIEDELQRQQRRRRIRQGTRTTMGGLKQDLAYAVRTFRRSPGFFVLAVLTLALALGGNTAIFSVVDAALLQALPFDDHEELVFVNGYHLVDGEVSVRGASFPEFRDWRDRTRSLSALAAVGSVSLTVTGDGEAARLATEVVTEGYFDILGAEPALGRTFLAEDHGAPDASPVVVLSHGTWERRFGMNPDVLGRDLILNDRPLRVVGVMPPGFGGTDLTTDAWIPESMISLVASSEILDARGSRFLTVVGRLAPGADVTSAQQELDGVARELQATFPSVHEDRFAQVVEFREGYLGSTGGLLWILLGAGVVLLLIAAANVANLMLVRTHGRTRELVLRRALGAEGGRIAAQLLTESVLLAVVGGVAGIGVAVWALHALAPMIPDGVLPGYVEPRLSGGAFAFSLAVLALVGMLIGLVPALSSARLDLAGRLREGGQGGGAGRRGRVRAQHAFVVAQVALALVLLVGAGLLTRSFRAQLGVDVGSELEGVQAMRLQLPGSRYDSNEVLWNFARELQQRIQAIPGAREASVSSDLPFRGGSSAGYIFREADGPEDRIRFHRHSVTPSFFPTLGVEVVEGRLLTEDDVDAAPGVVVITAAMARRVFPGESAVGRFLSLRPNGEMPVEVVGVVEDVRYRDVTTSLMADANSPDVFFSYWQIPSRGIEVAARGEGDVASLASSMRQVVEELDPNLPVFALQPLTVSWRAQTATARFAAFLMGLFSGLAALLACIGIYGVLAFTVGQRSREIAVRRAIGATGGRVARAVVGDGLRLTVFGLVVGLTVALAGVRVLEGFLYGIGTTDPITFAGVAAAMLATAVLGAVVPALRATRRDPAEALGAE